MQVISNPSHRRRILQIAYFKMIGKLFLICAIATVILNTPTCSGQVHSNNVQCNKPKMRAELCCVKMMQFAKLEDIMTCTMDAFMEFAKNPTGQMPKKGIRSCPTAKCVAQKANVLNPDGSLNRDALKNFMIERYDSGWEGIIKTAISTCNADVSSNDADCEIKQYFKCLKKQFSLNCPDADWSKDDKCTTLRSYFKNCKYVDNE